MRIRVTGINTIMGSYLKRVVEYLERIPENQIQKFISHHKSKDVRCQE